LIIRRLIVPLTVAVVTVCAGQGFAQGTFPAPLPSQAAPSNASPFPPVNGAAPSAFGAPPSSFPATGVAPVTGTAFARPPAPPTGGPPDECMKGFIPLREEAEKRGKLIKAAGDRRAPRRRLQAIVPARPKSMTGISNPMRQNDRRSRTS
jgi:hypothetical protein